jgi:RHS repeat-associated protein
VQRYEYNSFGEITYQQDPSFVQPYTYTGREYDTESGLYYYRARYYDAKIGRFITQDPFRGFFSNPQTLNPYPYVKNSPVTLIDPLGLASVTNLTNKDLWASGNRGYVTGSGDQVGITIKPGETVNLFYPKDGVTDVDQVEGKKLPGSSFWPNLYITEEDGILYTTGDLFFNKPLSDYPDFPKKDLPLRPAPCH